MNAAIGSSDFDWLKSGTERVIVLYDPKLQAPMPLRPRHLTLLLATTAAIAAPATQSPIRPPSPNLTAPLPAAICHAAPQAAGAPTTLAGWAAGAQLFDGLGTFHRATGTTSAEAQLYFDQAMRWLYAFNHDEATRSFARSAQADPNCALCYWGVAFAIGPNYNYPLMSAPRGQVAFAAMQRAIALAPHATPAEQALIAALALRYPTASAITASNYPTLQTAYAAAMGRAAAQFPADDDVLLLAAESIMGENAWRLWSLDGKPAPGVPQAIAYLQQILARNPAHPGANHYYIHAVEESPDPGRAEAAADRLEPMMPAAGHLVHMPSHIYQRIGRYADAARANDTAARADLAYFAHTVPLGGYAGYTGHNWDFEAFAAVEIGRRAETLAATRHARALYSDADMVKHHENGWNMARSYALPARFGLWADLAATPAPDAHLQGLTGAWLWARGLALAELGRLPEARDARSKLAALDAATKPEARAGFNALRSMFHMALLTLDARIAGASNNQPARLALLTQAVQAEDALNYDEPADWPMPTRPLLGRALLENHRPAEAEIVYREDLRRRPNNGWSLLGLSQSLAAQQKPDTARAAFTRVWSTADITPAYSAF
jgi:tetratricopeptide (TPR) repeat protein